MPLVSADYSQLELRISTAVWPDGNLADDILSGDVHSRTAERVSEISSTLRNLPKDELRTKAKGVTFGIVYGSKGRQISESLGCSLEEAEELVFAHKRAYPQLHKKIEESGYKIKKEGKVTTITGRTRPMYFTGKPGIDSKLIREGTNMLVQGPAAELTIEAQNRFARLYPDFFILNVHDGLYADCPPSAVQEVCEMFTHLMCFEAPTTPRLNLGNSLLVPLEIELKVGDNMADMVVVT
jgi:DNA polymerase-1